MARKGKYTVTDKEDNMIKWNVGLYIRLSSEDGDDKEESNSVTSQRELLIQYLEEHPDLVFQNFYIDDGYTGTNFNRPGFEKLLKDIYSSKINTVIVKDLSRLGRNYIKVGEYVENIFPLMKVRFIAVNDEIDSFLRPESVGNIMFSLKNVINEQYAKDISNKLKASLMMMRKKGKFIGTRIAYGYKKDPEDKHHLLVDEESAIIVKRIFEYYAEGLGGRKIADIFNNEKILTPINYINRLNNKPYTKDCLWTANTVLQLLKNEVYLGKIVSYKRHTISFKNKKVVDSKPEEIITVDNTHKAIITQELWDKVQQIRKSKYKEQIKRKDIENIYVGHLFCGYCGSYMHKKVNQPQKENPKVDFKCSRYVTYSNHSKLGCVPNHITKDEIDKVILSAIQLQVKQVICFEKILNKIKKKSKYDTNYNNASLLTDLELARKKLQKYKELKMSAYTDWKKNLISEKEYNELNEEYLSKISEQEKNITYLTKQNNKEKDILKAEWIKNFKTYKNITKLSKDIINELIEKIIVCENKNMIVHFKYADLYQDTLKFFKSIDKSAK